MFAFMGIALGLGIMLLLYSAMISRQPKPAATVVVITGTPHPGEPTVPPDATSAAGLAQTAFVHTSKTKPDVSYSVLIPKDARYEIADSGDLVTIRLKRGLTITTCTVCQMFVQGCNGNSDGSPEEGGCRQEPVDIGDRFMLDKHYQLSDQNMILGYTSGDRIRGTNAYGTFPVHVRVVADDFRELTDQDKKSLLPILNSIQ